MDFAILRGGVVKGKHYCPNPIVKYGIPAYADSIANPKVKNSPAYNSFWEEQIYYIKNGYTTGGITIPGRYYKFVNFDTIRSITGDNVRPEIHDYQLDYAYLVDHAKKEGGMHNIIMPKARRKAATTMNICMVIDYGYRFELNYKAAIVAGKQVFADVFYDEWRYIDSKSIPEFRIKKLRKGEITEAGWKEETPEGDTIEQGTHNIVYSKTVFSDPNVLKGLFLHDIVLEESGENEHLVEVFNASRDCLMKGSMQYGVMHIYGTGGNMNKGSKGFKKIYYDAPKFNCVQHFIPASVFLHPHYAGATDANGKIIEDIPNLMHLKPYERVGMSDEKRAIEVIKAESDRLLKIGDLEEYFNYGQNNPLNIKEVFRKSSSNNFDVIKLNDQGHAILSAETKKYSKYRLEFVTDDKGQVAVPYEVKAIAAKDDVPEEQCVMILDEGHPMIHWRNLDVAGIDSYDQDQSKQSKSLGAMVVFRRTHNLGERPQWLPVALIRNRPKRKEEFYEQCMMLAIYYNLIGGCLCDARTPMIMKHFQDRGCERFLSKKTKKFSSVNSTESNEYGQSLNRLTRPQMVSVLQSFFFMHTDKVWFPQLIEEALNYDEFEDGSDNDTIDALGLAIMKALDIVSVAEDEEEIAKRNPFNYPTWVQNQNGNMVDEAALIENIKSNPLEKEDAASRYFRMINAVDEEEEGTGAQKNDIYDI